MSLILGINAYHADAAAALVVDDQVVAAAEEERFRRIKHWAGFPSEAIRYCLEEGGIAPDLVEIVAVNTDPRVGKWRRIRHGLTHAPSIGLVLDRLRSRRRRLTVHEELKRAFPDANVDASVELVEHHRAHLASAYHASEFKSAVAVSVDGFGDFASAAWGRGDGPNLHVEGRVFFPHSLGILYQALTQYLGFPHYGDEYKVMGLAPYGEPTFTEAINRLVRTNGSLAFELDTRYFRHHRERIALDWDDGVPTFSNLYSRALVKLLGPARVPDEEITQRHKDVARSVQVVFEDVYLGLLRRLAERYPRVRNLALAGGCAQNSVANGKITRETPFESVYVAAAGYDAGGALGAALSVACDCGDWPDGLGHAYLGPRFSADQIAGVLRAYGAAIEAVGCRVERIDDESVLFDRTIEVMLSGGIVGWFQGRMEWGPRALGNRSILADPRRSDIKDILNRKIKRRESFRPFAPSILRERVLDWFEVDGDVPFMSHVFPIREEKRALIPAVTHVDGTGRLQTVTRDANPRYYGLIERFFERTGVPMLLNTSFNENEPIVCKPQEALDCFLRTKMDVLVLGDYFLRRQGDA